MAIKEVTTTAVDTIKLWSLCDALHDAGALLEALQWALEADPVHMETERRLAAIAQAKVDAVVAALEGA